MDRLPMTWTTPVVLEICAGLEVTAYLTAEM
jgi:coenzyme PQQ precursor peptide PqqA